MAVVSSPNSKASVSAPTKEKKRKTLGTSVEEDEGTTSDSKVDVSSSQPKKRNKNPGVRVIHGRVYDSENGTTCHQCRQKTYAVFASCKNTAKTKPCPLKYCNTCLLNRYGEKVEDVVLLDEWSCPKCRDACNCSICRKKRGYEPTGMLTQMAKAGGFASVSNMLDVKGNISNYKRVKETCASPRKQVASEEGIVITSPKKKGKENLFDGKTDSNANPSLTVASSVDEKPKKSNQKKLKLEESKEVENGNNDAIKPTKSNQKKLKPEESKEISLENAKPIKSNQKKLNPEESNEIRLEIGSNAAIKPTKSNQKKLKPEESKEMTGENGIKPKTITQKKLKPEDSKERAVGNENIGAIKPKKVNQKKLNPEGSTELIVENGNSDAIKPKKITQKKLKLEGPKEIVLENGVNGATKPKKMRQKKLKLEGSNEMAVENGDSGAVVKVNGGQKKQKGTKKSIQDQKEGEEKNSVNENREVLHGNVEKNGLKSSNNSIENAITFPTGSDLVTIAGVDIPKEDVGNALQLLEFCATFGKILDVKKGQPEAVLRDLIKVRSTRRGKCSVAIQFHIQLLSFIQSETESESESESESPKSKPTLANESWLKGLKSCIPKSYLSEKIDCIDGKTGGYDYLDSSTKLRLLTFLCDEVLGTEKIRNWIEDEKVKFAEKRKEARSKLSDARDKEKGLKQKMQDDIAKAIIEREGAPLTLLEHDAILSKIRKEAAEAHAEMLACKQMVPIDKERPDAVRTEPIFRDNDGHFYWKLKGCSDKPGILLQDIGTGDLSVETVDKWSEYDDEQMVLVEKHINIMRSRFRKGYKNQV